MGFITAVFGFGSEWLHDYVFGPRRSKGKRRCQRINHSRRKRNSR